MVVLVFYRYLGQYVMLTFHQHIARAILYRKVCFILTGLMWPLRSVRLEMSILSNFQNHHIFRFTRRAVGV